MVNSMDFYLFFYCHFFKRFYIKNKREIEHQVKDDNKNDDEFLECSITKQMPRCNCPIINYDETKQLNT